MKDLKKELGPGLLADMCKQHVQATQHSQGGPLMFIAMYPARFLPEDGKRFHVRFPDFPEALTGGRAALGFLPLGTGNSFLRDFTDRGSGYAIEVTARTNGTITVRNDRNGFERTYEK